MLYFIPYFIALSSLVLTNSVVFDFLFSLLKLRVIDSNGLAHPHTPSVMSDNIFGTNGDQVNLKSQMEDCSFNQLTILPGLAGTVAGNDVNEAALGVVEVTIDMDITSAVATSSRLDVRNAVTTAVQTQLGFELPGPYEHVLYVLEGCYGFDCGWAAYVSLHCHSLLLWGYHSHCHVLTSCSCTSRKHHTH